MSAVASKGMLGGDPPAVIARERLVIALVATAHMVSHFYLLVLIPLLPLLHATLGVSYIQLGLALTLSNITGAIAQTPVGILVDRFGPRKMLIFALALHGLTFGSLGLWPTYPWLLCVGVLNGLSQCIYHPADYDILNAIVAKPRVGRAFSYHTFSGYVGAAIAPALMIGVISHANLSTGLFVAALVGLSWAAVLAFSPVLDERTSAAAVAARDAAPVTLKKILSPTVIGLTAFFATLNLSQSALQNFSGLALEKLYGIPLSIAAAGLTAYLVGTAGGVLVGGHVADTTKHHGKVAAMGYSFTALFTFVLATWYFGPYGIVVLLGAAGFAVGMILPSRDMLVREAAPPGGVARTFGIVTTGFNFGGTIGPLMYGWLLDHNMPRELLLLALGFMVLSIAMPLIGEWRNRHVVAGGAVAA